MNKNKLKVVSLFSGYGTQELALKYIGVNYENVANCDNFKQANECYDVLHSTTNGNLGDITKVDENNFPQCDLLTYSSLAKTFQYLACNEELKKVQEVDCYLMLKDYYPLIDHNIC
jgi:hypothetical protein